MIDFEYLANVRVQFLSSNGKLAIAKRHVLVIKAGGVTYTKDV